MAAARGSIRNFPHVAAGPSRTPFKSPLWGAQLPLKHHDTCTLSSSSPVSLQVQARLFGPAIFEASKLKVLFLGEGKDTPPDELPRAYTLTHSDITSKITLAVSQTINIAQIQGWYNKLQRDEVLAEWRKSQGSMSLHVHCHISGSHWLLDLIAHLRFYIFRKELPVVLEAFRYGDLTLFKNYPMLEEAPVWVHFHSNEKEYNRVECWGPLREAVKGCASKEAREAIYNAVNNIKEQGLMDLMPSFNPLMMESIDVSSITQESASGEWKMPISCSHPCKCCFPTLSAIPLQHFFRKSDTWQDAKEQ